MINEMLFEHEAPSLDDIEKCLLEWIGINSEPVLKDMDALNLLDLIVNLLICVDLKQKEGDYQLIIQDRLIYIDRWLFDRLILPSTALTNL